MRLRLLLACLCLTLIGRAGELDLPQVGDHALRALSPTTLELFIVTRHGERSALADLVGENFTPHLPASETFAVAAGGQPFRVKSVGFKRRVLYAALNENDVRLGNWITLELAQPLAPGSHIEVSLRAGRAGPLGPPPEPASAIGGPSGPALPSAADPSPPPNIVPRSLWPADWRFAATLDPQRESPALHVSEIGYAPSLPKEALVGYYLGSAGELPITTREFQIIDAATRREAFRGPLVRHAEKGYPATPPPYQEVFAADFSALKTPGLYRLAVDGLGVSAPFRIHDAAPLALARAYALGLYHQRCGAENALPFTRFTHAACHIAPAEVPASAAAFPFTWKLIGELAAENGRELSRPPHPFTASEQSQLYPFVRRGPIDVSGGHHDAGDYSKYTSNSAALVHTLVFAVDALPGVAALDNLGLPESGNGVPDLLDEAKWEADFLAKLQDDDGGFYFLVYPRDRRYESNALPDAGEPQVVWPKNTAVTAAAVAALAQCASSPHFRRHFPRDAARYLAQAKRGWEFLQRALAQHGNDGAYQRLTHYGDEFSHRDELAWAACELFLATGDDALQRELFRWMPDPSSDRTKRWGWWRLSEGFGNAIRSYAFAARSGRLPADRLDARFLKLCEGELLAAADDALARTNASAYGTAFPLETKRARGGGWYFSLDSAFDLAVGWQLEKRDDYLAALVRNFDYEAGVNPLNRVLVTGLGRLRQREIVSQYAQNDWRVLPPSGLPIGNVQAGMPYHAPSKLPLRMLSFPDDGAAADPFAYLDRWSDTHNVSTEFIVTNQARGLASAAFFATLTPAAKQPWRAAAAAIALSTRTPAAGVPLIARLQLRERTLDLADADLIWEGTRADPVRAREFVYRPERGGTHRIEAEATWPDGRRVFGATEFRVPTGVTNWFDDAMPAGAKIQLDRAWQWSERDPAPLSGRLAHSSGGAGPGKHEHGFTDARDTLEVQAGDVLFFHVWLDPQNPPRELMVSWNDGDSWEHRAFWGDDAISYGKPDSPGRRAMGKLPATGKWVRLEVPARALDLEGRTVNGISFAALDGRVVWDLVGVRGASN